KYVRRRVVARTGGLWLARLVPFGIGAVLGGLGARVVARSVVEAMLEIFGQGTQGLEGVLTRGWAGRPGVAPAVPPAQDDGAGPAGPAPSSCALRGRTALSPPA